MLPPTKNLSAVTLLCAILTLSGCGGSDGPVQYHLNGEITFDGKPVPFGRIEFEPDTTRGNTGGMGYAEIVDGKYDTSLPGGRGVVGGPHIVRLTGMESRPPAPAANADGTIDETAPSRPQPPSLFGGYTVDEELPQENGATVNFTVPVEAAATAGQQSPRTANDP